MLSSSQTTREADPNASANPDLIQSIIPHAGAMCLLEQLVDWDETSICCETRSHLSADNPLRHKGRLSALTGIEYAAQAMAVHGGLKAAGIATHTVESPQPVFQVGGNLASGAVHEARHGYLASVRDCRCAVPYLDTLAGPLRVHARLLLDEGARVIYEFHLTPAEAGEITLVSGRAAVVLG